MALDSVASTVSVNALSIHGGEIQTNDIGIDIIGIAGVSLFGVTIEGNDSYGMFLRANTRHVLVSGCYFELNGSLAGDRDIVVGDTAATTYGITIRDSIFWDGSGSVKDHSIELIKSTNVLIEMCTFISYAVGGILKNATSSANLKGTWRRCETQVSGVVSTGDDTQWRQAFEEQFVVATTTHNFGLIADQSSEEVDLTVTGAGLGDFVLWSSGADTKGLVVSASITAADTVTLVASNNSGAGIDPLDSTIRLIVIPKSQLF
jgi:microcompartment protein CcmK/EutM